MKDLAEAVKNKLIEIEKVENSLNNTKIKEDQEFQPRLDALINCAGVIFAGDLDNTFP